MADWIIAGDEVRVPRPGKVLRDLGIRWRGEVTPAAPDMPDGLEQLTMGPPASEVTHRVTGRASEVRDFTYERDPEVLAHGIDFVLTVGTVRFQVQYGGSADQVPEGTRVSVIGRASVIGAYEWDDFELGEVRANWLVGGVLPRDEEGVMVILDPVSGFGPDVHDVGLAQPVESD